MCDFVFESNMEKTWKNEPEFPPKVLKSFIIFPCSLEDDFPKNRGLYHKKSAKCEKYREIGIVVFIFSNMEKRIIPPKRGG